jgi:prepilin-type N-terminal cleavage/methylation domain-containing protein
MLKNRLRTARTAATNAQSGFTLIELLIVIVVLGILAGIVVFGVGTFRADAKAAACGADTKTVSVAADAWIAKSDTTPTLAQLVTAKYLKAAPTALTAIAINANGDVTGTCA